MLSVMILGGELHFLQIGGTCDDIDEADILVDGSLSKSVEQSSEGTKPLSNPSSPGITGKLHVFKCIISKNAFVIFGSCILRWF